MLYARPVIVQQLVFFMFVVFACMHSFCNADDSSSYYGIYRNAKIQYPLEKEFVTNLKPSNPDDLKTGGYTKFRATLLTDDKSAMKELDFKADIVRSVVLDTISGFQALDLQSSNGRAKLAASLTASINAILTDSKIMGVAFGDFVIQP